jgi:hypothetical protein
MSGVRPRHLRGVRLAGDGAAFFEANRIMRSSSGHAKSFIHRTWSVRT